MSTEHKILDQGFIRLVDSMGTDASIVQAARVSYGEGTKGAEADKKLIHYLLKHDHGTPFEMVTFKWHVKCPIFVARQWQRHRMGSYNEISARYTEMEDQFYIPEQFRMQSVKNKQSSDTTTELNHNGLREMVASECGDAYHRYEYLISRGVAREQARMILPVNIYTQFYWCVNARSLMNFIRLRADSHAQWEIQQYASALLKDMGKVVPWTTEFLVESMA